MNALMTTRKRCIVANWKMNCALDDATNLFQVFLREMAEFRPCHFQLIVCPSAPYLGVLKEMRGRLKRIGIGGQNASMEQEGALTGEVSPRMIRDFAEFVIVGHSERRLLFGETDEIVHRKLRAALDAGLSPILCIGESLSDYNEGKTVSVLRAQLAAALDAVDAESIPDILLAYEPVWSISTMSVQPKPPTREEMMSVSLFLRKELAMRYRRDLAERVSILYGGSVTKSNISEFIGRDCMDGALVGGASVRVSEFQQILRRSNAAFGN